MNFIDKAISLISQESVKKESINFLEDTLNALLGDPVSAGKIIVSLAHSPSYFREQIFWAKLSAFLNGVYLDEDDCAILRAKLTQSGEKGDNPARLLFCIDKVETKQKIHYLINATRCLLTDFIDLSTYFRICNIISQALEEDLVFLKENITKTKLAYNQNVQGLLNVGLMYQSEILSNDEVKYSFSPFADIINRYAISYSDVDSLDPTIPSGQNIAPQTRIASFHKIEEALQKGLNLAR